MKISKKNYTLNLVAWLKTMIFLRTHFLENLNVHAPVKKKSLRANHAPYMTKALRKNIMKRSELK